MSTDPEKDQIENIEIIPDFENEQVEQAPKKKGCGCQNKTNASSPESNKYNWQKIGLIVLGLILAYFVFVKKGKIVLPEVEVPKV
jgi:hypothetical protein